MQLYIDKKSKFKITMKKRADNLKKKVNSFLGEEVERMLFVWGRITFSIVIINNYKKLYTKIKKIFNIFNNNYYLKIIIDFFIILLLYWYKHFIFFIIIKE